MSDNNTQTIPVVWEDGEAILQLPDDLMNRLDWKAGDDLEFIPQPDNSFLIKRVKMTSVPIDLDEKDLYKLMLMAHEQGITLDRLINNILSQLIEEKT